MKMPVMPEGVPEGCKDLWSLKTEWVLKALIEKKFPAVLSDLFGAASHKILQDLAGKLRPAESPRPIVLIVPGMAGSTLGYPKEGAFDDCIWLNPAAVADDRFADLDLNADKDIKPLGVVLVAYLALKLRLEIAGFDARFYPYDWRQSFATLGAELARHIGQLGQSIQIVAHGSGGLLVRAACATAASTLTRVITLGSPDAGSFMPLRLLRGQHGLIGTLAILRGDASVDGRAACSKIFASFPSLLELLPILGNGPPDYFSLAGWPVRGYCPDQDQLDAARSFRQTVWSPAAGRGPEWVQLTGEGRETTVKASLGLGNAFYEYAFSCNGDGLVPTSLAALSGATQAYYLRASHGSMGNSQEVAAALVDILRTGHTQLLPETPTSDPIATTSWRLSDDQLSESALIGRGDDPPLSADERRELLSGLVAPVRRVADAVEAEASSSTTSSGRRLIGSERRRLDVNLVHGDITDVDSRAYVLGLFLNVTPLGAAQQLDRLMRGALGMTLRRRMFVANAGTVAFVPRGRSLLRADFLTLVGLGAFDRFEDRVFGTLGESLARTLVSAGLDDVAMLPFGNGSNAFSAGSLECLFDGFLRGLQAADPDQQFRSLTICERDADRFKRLRDDMKALYEKKPRLFKGFDIRVRESSLPAAMHADHDGPPSGPEAVYLIARQERTPADLLRLRVSLLTARPTAAILGGVRVLNQEKLAALLRRFSKDPPQAGPYRFSDMPAAGKQLAELVLPENIIEELGNFQDHPLVIVHDAGASQIPWEVLRIGDGAPALRAGVSHRYESGNLGVAKWRDRPGDDGRLDVLLIVNPTGDLGNAQREACRVRALLQPLKERVRVTAIGGTDATRKRLLEEIGSGLYDVVHYAGHAFFDESNAAASGLLCADREVLTGQDLLKLGQLPSLLFINGCESARISKGDEAPDDEALDVLMRRNIGFAEALLISGVANFIGTYWPVSDRAAGGFAEAFYRAIVDGATLGAAVIHGRRWLERLGERDWADYLFYGEPNAVLARPENGGSPAQ